LAKAIAHQISQTEKEIKYFYLVKLLFEISPQVLKDIREDLETIKENKLKGELA
jgi:hypothetical protein